MANQQDLKDRIQALPPLRDLVDSMDMRARKSLGQNFLFDLSLTRQIARSSRTLSGTTIEVGPGPGGLTRALLLEGASHVIAIEKDQDCVAALGSLKTLYKDQLHIVEADALAVKLDAVSSEPVCIVSNLPYNVSTPLLLHWLRQISQIRSMTLMFQKEVADRLIATPSTKAYGRLSIMTQWLCDTRHLFNVDKRAFFPPPKVMSSVILLRARPEPLAPANWHALEEITAAAFNQRRKMLRSSLKAYQLDFTALKIDPELRAENLSIEQFCLIARAISR